MAVRRKVVAGVAVAGLVAGATASTAPAVAAERPGDPVPAAIEALVRGGFPGAVAYSRDGERVRHAAAGVANLATGEPARTGHRFRIASNTKAFVATVLLQLVGEGELSLDDSVEKWLPGVVRGPGYHASEITVRQLLGHTSGIHDPLDPDFFDPYLEDGDRGYVYPPDEVIRKSLVDPPSQQKPTYSNTNYLLVGKIIERVTGHSVSRELRERILWPLGLHDTSFPIVDPFLHGPHLHGYNRDGTVDLTVFSPSYDWTAGALVSTVDDLAKFHRALFDGRLLAPEQQRALRTVTAGDGNVAYGLGVERWELPCQNGQSRTVWGNSGAGPGYYSLSFTSEDGARQVVIALNSYDLAVEIANRPGELPWPTPPAPALLDTFC
ncbi:serine hydrolase domain-containing protein [Amycolatopsis nigrescens]|uniref:serine hydrolase domain-containing protein n=1 Tax=Amycolatopsis nigrescens TaxID=381445 RepID=UPI000378468E|nr:serine hydrolase domain-containing protein [Amycolatopsis nigrescens]